MNMTRHTESVEVIFKDQRRRRWSLAEKSALVRRTYPRRPPKVLHLWPPKLLHPAWGDLMH